MKADFEKYIKKYPEGPVHLLIPGHGGVDEEGNYHIIKPGSKQANVNGRMIYEGEHNRRIAASIIKQRPDSARIANLVPEVDDIPRLERIQRINKAFATFTDAGFFPIIWELHLNAFNGKASGTEIYTTRGDNLSDRIATIWWNEAQRIVKPLYPEYNWRPDNSDGDPDKEKDYDVIHESKAFGTLIEFFFFDHPWSVDNFLTDSGVAMWASTVIAAINEINSYWK